MSNVTENQTGSQSTSPASNFSLGIVRLSGRISGSRSVMAGGSRRVISLLTIPAASVYDRPGVVELASIKNLGAVGDDFVGLVRVSGSGYAYDVTDEQTGQKVKVQTARSSLTVIEG